MDLACGVIAPALDTREETFNSRAISLNGVNRSVPGCWERDLGPVAVTRDQFGHQVFGVGQDEDVRFIIILIARQAFISLPGDHRDRQMPAETEWAVASA